MKSYCKVLTIAGSDSGAGAGIQADLKTFAALECYGMSVITAVTAQNTQSVTGVHPVPIEFVSLQLDAVLQDMAADAVKIGMLHSTPVINSVAEKLLSYHCSNIVVDPVMAASSGDELLRENGLKALTSHLFPLATLITPNLPEASILLGREVVERQQMADACRDLSRLGGGSVLLKGGHLGRHGTGGCVDMLYDSGTGSLVEFTGDWVETPNSHGTGCTLSSAIAAFLAKGLALADAVGRAKNYVSRALQAGAGIELGNGHGPVHHFHHWWQP